MNFKKNLLSIGIAATLTACGGGGSSKSPAPGLIDPAPGVAEKNSLVCIDVNQNARCDTGETSEQVVTWKETAVATTLVSANSPLAYEGENGYIFTAPAGFTTLSLDTTLLNNELIYNQVITTKTDSAVSAYLADKFGGELTAENKTDLSMAVKNTLKAHASSDRYAVIAAVINKAIALDSASLADLKNITVSDQEITDANLPSLVKLVLTELTSQNVDNKIAEQEAAGWIDATDSSMRTLSAKNGKIIAGSHYHNALTVLDVASDTVTYSSVAVLTDAGHGVDAASGASENYLRDAVFNADASYAYVNIPPKNASSETADQATYGFYKVKIEADNSVKTITAGTVIAIDDTESKRLAAIVSSFAVAADDSNVVIYDNEDNLTVYDGNLENISASKEVEKIKTFAVSSSAVFTVTENADNEINNATKGDINKLAIDTLAVISKITLDFIPAELHLNADGTKLLAFNHGHDNNGQMDIALIDLTNDSVNASSVKITSDTASISEDFTKLAIVGHEESRLLIVNLTVPGFSVQSSHTLDGGSQDVAFIGNSQVAILASSTSITVLDITSTTDNTNLDAKMALALDGLNAASINGGGYFNAVIQDMVLSPNYENVTITWSEAGLSNNLDVTSGAVTRPLVAGMDAAGVLTANTSASFRGDSYSDSKEFDITVRKTPESLPVASVVQTADNSSDYMATNVDGNIMVAPVRFENANDDRVYGFNSVEVVGGQPVLRSGTADTPKTYRDTESLVGVGIYGSNVIGVSAAVGDAGQARIFTVIMDDAGILEDSVNNTIDITSGKPLKVGFNSDQSIAGVMIQKEDESYITEIYSIANNGTLTLDRTITMEPGAEYKSYGPPAINNTGMVVYQRDGDNVIMSAFGGETASAAVVEIARVWFYNDQVFVNTYEGNITSFNASLDEASRQEFSTGTGGRMYGAAGREIDGTHYLFIPVQNSANATLNGIYQLEIKADGSLKEVALSVKEEGADRMAVSGDGDTVFFSYRIRSGDDKGRYFGVVEIPTP